MLKVSYFIVYHILVVLSLYQIISFGNINKSRHWVSTQQNLESFNPQMEHLSTDFKNAICEDVNIYAFGEGLPIDKNWVRFSFHHIESYPTWFNS